MTETEQAAEVVHGSLSAYTSAGCRCDECRLNWNAYQRWYRVEQRGRTHACPTCSCAHPPKPTTERADTSTEGAL